MKSHAPRKSAPRIQDPRNESSADSSPGNKRQQREFGKDRDDAHSNTSEGDPSTHAKAVKKDPEGKSSRRRNELLLITITASIGFILDLISFNEDAKSPMPNRAINYALGNLPFIMVLWKYEISKIFKK